jgi:predicted glutamine amidotransferase
MIEAAITPDRRLWATANRIPAMCRFTFYLGHPIKLSSLLTEPAHSLINQSFAAREREEPLNGDGFGVAWYVTELNEEPARFRSISPAWSNSNLIELARVVRSTCILAHVRAATQHLAVMEANCHPFKCGRFAFMHNGDIGGFDKLRRHVLTALSDSGFDLVRGSTDSEHFFALLMDELAKGDDAPGVGAIGAAFERTIRRVRELQERYAPKEHIYLNAVITDGERAAAVRYTSDDPSHASSLYLNQGRRYICEDGVCLMADPNDDQSTAIVSSEPLSQDPSWSRIEPNTMLLLEKGKVVDTLAI